MHDANSNISKSEKKTPIQPYYPFYILSKVYNLLNGNFCFYLYPTSIHTPYIQTPKIGTVYLIEEENFMVKMRSHDFIFGINCFAWVCFFFEALQNVYFTFISAIFFVFCSCLKILVNFQQTVIIWKASITDMHASK